MGGIEVGWWCLLRLDFQSLEFLEQSLHVGLRGDALDCFAVVREVVNDEDVAFGEEFDSLERWEFDAEFEAALENGEAGRWL